MLPLATRWSIQPWYSSGPTPWVKATTGVPAKLAAWTVGGLRRLRDRLGHRGRRRSRPVPRRAASRAAGTRQGGKQAGQATAAPRPGSAACRSHHRPPPGTRVPSAPTSEYLCSGSGTWQPPSRGLAEWSRRGHTGAVTRASARDLRISFLFDLFAVSHRVRVLLGQTMADAGLRPDEYAIYSAVLR